MGLAVSFNGHRPVLLELDTGASGILLNPAAAGRAGIVSVSTAHMLGIGDAGDQSTKVGIVEQLRIGDVEFANFPVEIGDRKVMEDVQGLIGTDVFSRFLIKLNLPGSLIELTPLPPYPDGNEDWEAHDRQLLEATPASVMARRTGHLLLVQTVVNERRMVWFGVDTGASVNLINEELARKTTHVGADDTIRLKGVSGEVKKVLVASSVRLQFGHFTQDNDGMVAYDMNSMNRSHEVEVSGLLGWPILRQLIVTLNYRDGLIDFVHPLEQTKKR